MEVCRSSTGRSSTGRVHPARASAPHVNAIIVSIAATMRGRAFSGRGISVVLLLLMDNLLIGVLSKRLGIDYLLVEAERGEIEIDFVGAGVFSMT